MTVQTATLRSSTPKAYTSDISKQYLEGMVAGIVGAATISILILVWDTINGQPLYTPSMLGTALFGRGEELSAPESMRVSVELTLMYTWVHGLIFAVIGGIASRLVGFAEKNPDLGFGIVLLFVVLEFGFIGAAYLFVEPVLQTLAWPAVLFANLAGAAAMAGYLWYQHPNLTIRP